MSALDPAVLSLLEEAVLNPRSSFTRIPPKSIGSWITDRSAVLSDNDALLTKAQRHVIQAHREELAKALYRASHVRLTQGPQAELRYRSYGGHRKVLSDPSWAGKARELLSGTSIGLSREEGLLDRFLGVEGRGGASALELVQASMLLAPSDEARLTSSVALNQEGQRAVATRLYFDVLSHHPSELNGSIAWNNLGFMHEEKRLPYLRRAAKTKEMLPNAMLSWFAVAVQWADESEALESAARVSELDPGYEDCVQEVVAVLSAQQKDDQGRPRPESRALISKLRDRVPAVARRVLDVL